MAWDDEEEATEVFDRAASEAEDDEDLGPTAEHIVPAAGSAPPPEVGGAPQAGSAAALLAASGHLAVPAALESAPKIPAPAPIPQDISSAAGRAVLPSEAAIPSEEGALAQADWATGSPQQGTGRTTRVLSLVAVAVLAVAAFFYLRSTGVATVTISITHQGSPVDKANIYIDGQKKCEFAPCKLELKPGQKDVRVVAGPLSGTLMVQVEGGQDRPVSIELAPASDGNAVAGSEALKPATAGLTLSSGMKDAALKVFIDGKEMGVLEGNKPLELKNLRSGQVTLRLEGGEKFGRVEKTLELKSGEVTSLSDLVLPLLQVKVTFQLKTPRAKVTLTRDGGGESKLRFRGGRAAETLDTSHTWIVRASAKGYDTYTKTLDFDGVRDSKVLEISLTKTVVEPVAAVPAPASKPVAKGSKSETKTQAKVEYGTLNANSIPPSKVIIDGRPRGGTPVTGVRVAAGPHTVIFRHKEFGSKSRTITVKAGESKTAVVRFKKKAKK